MNNQVDRSGGGVVKKKVPRTVPAVCQHCGKDFQALAAEVKRGDGRFCSRSCSSRANTASRLMTLRAAPKKPKARCSRPRERVRCERCGRLFMNVATYEEHVHLTRNGQAECLDPQELEMRFTNWGHAAEPSWGRAYHYFWTSRRKDTLRRLVERGWSDEAIARHFGRTSSAVVAQRYLMGLRYKQPNPEYREYLHSMMQKMKWSKAQFARELGVEKNTLNDWLFGRRIPLRPSVRKIERLMRRVS